MSSVVNGEDESNVKLNTTSADLRQAEGEDQDKKRKLEEETSDAKSEEVDTGIKKNKVEDEISNNSGSVNQQSQPNIEPTDPSAIMEIPQDKVGIVIGARGMVNI